MTKTSGIVLRNFFLAVLFFVSAIPASAQEATTAKQAVAKNDYSQSSSWLCRPGGKDACAVDLSTTIVAADGTLTEEKWTPNPDPPIDCFYVYPTVSWDPTLNSDMNPGPEERIVIQNQFARFGSQCRLYAPLYRQVTLKGIGGKGADRKLAYNDVLDAWNYYLKNDNRGRGVVLIGHSQGAGMLEYLIRNEIEGKPVQSRIISAMLLGKTIQVPPGKDVGGTFKYMPLCRKATDTGCIITYVSFRSTIPPPKGSQFGQNQDNTVAACTNPAALEGGSGSLHAYLSSTATGITGTALKKVPWVSSEKEIKTPFVSLPGLLTAKCVSTDRATYLEITVHGDPKDPRTDDIGGDVSFGTIVAATWGLHMIDVNLAMANLLDIVSKQAKSYLSKK